MNTSGLLSSDESDDEGTLPMNLATTPWTRYRWAPSVFCESALSMHFGQAGDSPSPFFETYS